MKECGLPLSKKYSVWAIPGGSDGKESACNTRDLDLIPGSGRPSGEWNATHSSILAWRMPWRNLVAYSPWDHKESNTPERLTLSLFTFKGPELPLLILKMKKRGQQSRNVGSLQAKNTVC